MDKLFGASWRSTLGGILLALQPAVATSVLAAGYTSPKWLTLVLTLSTTAGGLILGINAKDKQVHSTEAQVQAATVEAPVRPS